MSKSVEVEVEDWMGAIIMAVVLIGVVALVGAFVMGSVKVSNELKMTKAYDRQAAALERIADAVVIRLPMERAKGPATLATVKMPVVAEKRAGTHLNGDKWTEKHDCNTAECSRQFGVTICSRTAMLCGGE